MLDTKFFRQLSFKVIKLYKHHIWKAQKDVFDKKFKSYKSKSYERKKNKGDLRRQSAESKGKTAPIVSGDFKNDFKLIDVSSKGFTVGWAAHGSKVNWLADNKRYVTKSNQPLPEEILDEIDRSARIETERQIPKNKVVHIKVGK